MKRTKLNLIILVVFIITLNSCENSSTPLRDGYTLYGTIMDSTSEERISSVLISVGYQDYTDSVYFDVMTTISDTLGEFIYKGGIGTAPSDEVLRFEHINYKTKDLIVRDNTTGGNSRYTMFVYLIPKQ